MSRRIRWFRRQIRVAHRAVLELVSGDGDVADLAPGNRVPAQLFPGDGSFLDLLSGNAGLVALDLVGRKGPGPGPRCDPYDQSQPDSNRIHC